MKEYTELKVIVNKNAKTEVYIDGKQINATTLKLEVNLRADNYDYPKLEVSGNLDPQENLFDLIKQE